MLLMFIGIGKLQESNVFAIIDWEFSLNAKDMSDCSIGNPMPSSFLADATTWSGTKVDFYHF